MKTVVRKALIITIIVLFVTSLSVNFGFAAGISPTNQKTYTFDKDFDEGTLFSVEHVTVHDQLQLSHKIINLPFIWVPNATGTVSKVDTNTGKELGRYWVAPHNGDPSRTTVDQDGSCYVGCRAAGTVVKIGLAELGQFDDRNGDGICQTSQDLNNDGNITGAEILPWGQDECVLYEVVLIPGHEGTYDPGTYPGPYDNNTGGTAPRGLAVDKNNNVWAASYSGQKFYYLDGSTGQILRTINLTQHYSYGAVMDKNGILWSVSRMYTNLLRIDPATSQTTRINLNSVYGVGLDSQDHLFIAGYDNNTMTRVNINTATVDWVKSLPGLVNPRGVVCYKNPDHPEIPEQLWVANSGSTTATVYDIDGNIQLATINGLRGPSGVAVGTNDVDPSNIVSKIWACDIGSENIYSIDPVTYTKEITKTVVSSSYHYTYSDMTGYLSRIITCKVGNWTVIRDSNINNAPWGILTWNSFEPAGTSITVKVRSSNDQVSWSTWEAVVKNTPLTATPNGRYLQIDVTFKILAGEVSPILYDLTVSGADNAPILNHIGDRTGTVGALIQFRVSAFDPDGNPLTWTVSGLPAGATFDVVRKIFSWTPDTAGVYSGIHFEVSDGILSSSEDIKITVN
ncbi:MAG TPA: putative Ig domain-containing protein [Bacillota bacterium]|nr:putative Ig domain-containing protein [Bacillota bacterium]